MESIRRTSAQLGEAGREGGGGGREGRTVVGVLREVVGCEEVVGEFEGRVGGMRRGVEEFREGVRLVC